MGSNLMKHALAVNPSTSNEVQLAAVQQLIGKELVARQTLDKAIARDRNNEETLLQRFKAILNLRN